MKLTKAKKGFVNLKTGMLGVAIMGVIVFVVLLQSLGVLFPTVSTQVVNAGQAGVVNITGGVGGANTTGTVGLTTLFTANGIVMLMVVAAAVLVIVAALLGKNKK